MQWDLWDAAAEREMMNVLLVDIEDMPDTIDLTGAFSILNVSKIDHLVHAKNAAAKVLIVLHSVSSV